MKNKKSSHGILKRYIAVHAWFTFCVHAVYGTRAWKYVLLNATSSNKWLFHNINVTMDFHSRGNLLLYAWSFYRTIHHAHASIMHTYAHSSFPLILLIINCIKWFGFTKFIAYVLKFFIENMYKIYNFLVKKIRSYWLDLSSELLYKNR